MVLSTSVIGMQSSNACDAALEDSSSLDDIAGSLGNAGMLAAQEKSRSRKPIGPAIGWVALRLLRHMFVFVPLAALYLPCWLVGSQMHDLWWKGALFALESSGPALVKLGQWAATRSDLFPTELCRRLSQLHAGARTHPLHESAVALDALLRGSNYSLLSIDPEPIGSGCIAQVHRAVIAPQHHAAGNANADPGAAPDAQQVVLNFLHL